MSCSATRLWLPPSGLCAAALDSSAITLVPNPLLSITIASVFWMVGSLLFVVRKRVHEVGAERFLLAISLGISALSINILLALQGSEVACSHTLRFLFSLSRVIISSAMLLRARYLRPNARLIESHVLTSVGSFTIGLVLMDAASKSEETCMGHSWTATAWLMMSCILQPILLTGCGVRAILYMRVNACNETSDTDNADQVDESRATVLLLPQYNQYSGHSLFAAFLLHCWTSGVIAFSTDDSRFVVPAVVTEICGSVVLLLWSHADASSMLSSLPMTPLTSSRRMTAGFAVSSTPTNAINHYGESDGDKTPRGLHKHDSVASSLPMVHINRNEFGLHCAQTPRHLRLVSIDQKSMKIEARTP